MLPPLGIEPGPSSIHKLLLPILPTITEKLDSQMTYLQILSFSHIVDSCNSGQQKFNFNYTCTVHTSMNLYKKNYYVKYVSFGKFNLMWSSIFRLFIVQTQSPYMNENYIIYRSTHANDSKLEVYRCLTCYRQRK